MAEQVWVSGRLTAVYQPVGTNSAGEVRYRRAPFDLLEWASTEGGAREVYVSTLGAVTADSDMVQAVDEAHEVGREFGYYHPGIVVLEPHQGNGNDDTWVALQSFGYI